LNQGRNSFTDQFNRKTPNTLFKNEKGHPVDAALAGVDVEETNKQALKKQ
jgi:hypothetical protein